MLFTFNPNYDFKNFKKKNFENCGKRVKMNIGKIKIVTSRQK